MLGFVNRRKKLIVKLQQEILELKKEDERKSEVLDCFRGVLKNIPDLEFVEIYMWNLLEYIASPEFPEHSVESQHKLIVEFEQSIYRFNIICNFNNVKKGKGIIAFKDTKELDFIKEQLFRSFKKGDTEPGSVENQKILKEQIKFIEEKSFMVYSFTSIEVASKVLDCEIADIVECLSETKEQTNGFIFQFEETWDKEKPIEYNKFRKNKQDERKDRI